MHLRHVLFLTLLASAVSVRADEPAFDFSGVMTTGGKTRIALTDRNTKTTTWLETGQEFRGYTITRYDPRQDVVFLKKAGQETRLALVQEKTSDARANSATASSTMASLAAESTATAIRANLRLLASAARQYQLQHGATTVSYSDLVGPDKLIKELKPVAGENYSTLAFGPNVTGVNVTTATGSTVTLELPPAAGTASSTVGIPPADSSSTTSSLAGAANPAVNLSGSLPPPVTAPAGTPGVTAPAEPLPPTGRQPVLPNYTVQAGDTWEKISTATGIPIQQLKQMNPAIPEGTALPSGQMIRTR